MKPNESPLFNYYDTNEIASQALRAEETQRTYESLSHALLNPDKVEEYEVSILTKGVGMHNSDIQQIDKAIRKEHSLATGRSIGDGVLVDTSKAKIYEPFEKATSEDYPGIEFTTSVVAFDLYDHDLRTESSEADNQLILFRLSSTEQPATASDLELGVNCVFGAIIQRGQIKPFMLKRAPSEQVVSRLERNDPTEESGKSTDAQVVQVNPNQKEINIVMLSGDEYEGLEQSVLDEINKFIKHREDLDQKDNPQE